MYPYCPTGLTGFCGGLPTSESPVFFSSILWSSKISERCQPLAAAWSLVTGHCFQLLMCLGNFLYNVSIPEMRSTSFCGSSFPQVFGKSLGVALKFSKTYAGCESSCNFKSSVFFTDQLPKLAKYMHSSLLQKQTKGGRSMCFLCENPVRTFFWYI